MSLSHTFASSVAAILLAVPLVRAQDVGAPRIATCNPGKVLEAMDEKKDLEEKMKRERDDVQKEIERRKAEVREIQSEMFGGGPIETQHRTRSRSKELMEKAVEYEVWKRLTDAELKRQEQEQRIRLQRKIKEGVAAVAVARKIDLVLVERGPDAALGMDDPSDASRVPSTLDQGDVLYSAPRIDITADVIIEVNRKFAGGAVPAPAAPGDRVGR